jgi:5-methylcytosine-specific restriction endonuclease McrA
MSTCPTPEKFTPYADTPGVCDACGVALTGAQRRWCSSTCSMVEFNAHSWNGARHAARKRDGYACVKCGSKRELEVNHIEPRVGRGYGWGCHNHPDNLETLCHDCHLVVTRNQHAARAAARRTAARAIAIAAWLEAL